MAEEYYSLGRQEMLRYLPADCKKLIDLGCGEGRFGENVKRMLPNCETWGVEPHERSAEQASLRNDNILNMSLEQSETALRPHLGTFDVVTMNDVLEHLLDSEFALRLAKGLLSPKGRLILSLPNVRYYVNVMNLVLKGDWEYQDFGILDRTHLRFFTFKSAKSMLERNGYEIICLCGINKPKLKIRHRVFFSILPGSYSDAQYPQFAIVARPCLR